MANSLIRYKYIFTLSFICLLFIAHLPHSSYIFADEKTGDQLQQKKITTAEMIEEIKNRIDKWNWDSSFFVKTGWKERGTSVYGRPLIYWTCGDEDNKNSSLILSAVHGDEVTPVYFGFRLVEWLKARPELCKDSFIIVAPIVNPDGFLRYTNGTRTNYNKVDLNRNFDTPEWKENAQKIWKERYGSQRRYFPGDLAASEPEVAFQKWLIQEFNPTKILSVHAPLNHLDFDGPIEGSKAEVAKKFTETYIRSCDLLKKQLDQSSTGLNFFAYGTFPGSLGNYAGRHIGIPTITVELPTTNHTLAPKYFSQMENGLKVFLSYELEDRPARPVANKN